MTTVKPTGSDPLGTRPEPIVGGKPLTDHNSGSGWSRQP